MILIVVILAAVLLLFVKVVEGRNAVKCLAAFVAVGIAVVAFGPTIAGYHHGYGGLADALSNEHCIRWFGSVWCRS